MVSSIFLYTIFFFEKMSYNKKIWKIGIREEELTVIYLLLAIASSAMVSLTMRITEKHIQNNMAMFAANYTICLVLARYFMGDARILTIGAGSGAALGLGVLSGILYLLNFVLLQTCMRHNGIVLSSTFMKLGVLVPTIMAIAVFREQPKILQIVGMAAALAAIIMIHFDKEDSENSASSGKKNGRKSLLILLLLVSGFTDSMANIYDKTGLAVWKEHYLFYTFLAALLAAVTMAVRERKGIRISDLLSGVLIGIPNYFSARFLLLALGSVPAVITYPVYSVATIVVISLVSALLLKETVSTRKKQALVLIIFALICLNL